MGNVTRGASGGLIAWPNPVKHKLNGNWTNTANWRGTLYQIPDLNANDGSYWLISPSAGTIARYNASNVLQWTIAAAADVNASATTVLAFLIDYTDAKIYAVYGGASLNAPYFVSNPLATKTVAVAAITTAWSNTGDMFLDRPGGQGTGNLRMYLTPRSNAGVAQQQDVTSAGVISGSTTTFSLGGVQPWYDTNSVPSVPYVTQAALLHVAFENGAPMLFRISRGGGIAAPSSGWTNRPIVQGTSNVRPRLIVNGANINFYTDESGGGGTGITSVPKTFVRADFDAFLNVLADAGGCP